MAILAASAPPAIAATVTSGQPGIEIDQRFAINTLTLVMYTIGLAIIVAAAILWLIKPRFLSKPGRAPLMNPGGGGLVLLAYFVLPLLLAGIVGRLAVLISPDATQASSQRIALMMWLGHLASIIAVAVWIVVRRRDTGTPGPGGISGLIDSVRTTVDRPSVRAPRGWLMAIVAAPLALILAWPAIQVTAVASSWMWRVVTGEPSDPIAHETLRRLSEASLDPWTWAIIAAVVIGAPLIEEVIYRGTMHATFKTVSGSAATATLFTSMIFAFLHLGMVPLQALPGLVVLGIALSLAYEWTGRLTTPMLMHALFNFINVAQLYAHK